MAKEKWLEVGEVYVFEVYVGEVYLFHPILLRKKRPISLDLFMEPFIKDIEDGFIDGIVQLLIYSAV